MSAIGQGQEAVDRRNQEAWEAYEAEKAALKTSNADGQAAVDERNRQGQEAVDRRNQERWEAYEAEKAALKTSNEDGQAAVDERNRQGQAAVDSYNRDEQARIDAINAQLDAEYQAKLQAQADVEAHNAGVRERNAQAQAVADAENARLQAEYERQLAEAQAKTSQEGYLSTVEVQALSLRHSTAPRVAITDLQGISFDKHTLASANNSRPGYVFGHGEATTNPDEAFSPDHDPYKTGPGGSYHLYSPTGQFSFTATYTNLDGITHDGQPVSKVVYRVIGRQSSETTLVAYEDPANFFEWAAHGQRVLDLEVFPEYYDKNSQRIDVVDNSLFYVESLENNIDGLGAVEKVSGTGGRFLLVNGSSIQQHGDEYYSDTDNWTGDTKGNWYRSVVFKPTSNDFSLRFTKTPSLVDSYIWVGMQTSLKINNVPTPPAPFLVEPEQENPIPPTPAVPNWVTPTFKEFTPEVFVPETREIKPPTPEVFVPEVFVPETREIKPPTPEVFTPEVFTPETYTPIEPELLPPVRIPEKETFSAQVRPVVVKVTVTPSKDVVDESGLSINGQSVLPNSTLNYVAKQDFNYYKGITLDSSAILKNFLYVDDYLDEALDGQSMVTNAITAANGDDVAGLFEMRHVLSQDTLDEKLQALIKDSGISPVGEFYLWVAKDPEAFYKAYVQKGLDVTYNLSFKIKDGFVGTVTNQTYQIDFGRGYYGNIVTNDVPPLMVFKTVQDTSGKDINGQTVKLGDELDYTLEGWVIPAGRGYDIHEYRFVDMLQVSHDQYRNHRVTAKVAFALTDGISFKKGDDLMPYTEMVYNSATGQFELRFTQDFLDRVPRSSEFGSDVVVRVKRIASGHVENEYTNHVNGYPVVSNKVTTDTPEPPAPPVPPTPPVSDTPRLPETGDASSGLAMVTGIMTTVLGLVGLGRKKED